MPLWGRNDQSVTANSTTTVESTTGAPIGTYTAVKLGGGANAHFGNTSTGSRAATDVNMFDNTTPSAFMANIAVGVFGVSANEATNPSSEKVAHAGWNLRRAGTGPAVSAVYTNSGVGYNNADLLVVKSPVAGGNATFNISTNATGGTAAGNTTVTYFTVTAGGRAGRVHHENLVAMGSLGAQTAAYGAAATANDSTSDNTFFPGV